MKRPYKCHNWFLFEMTIKQYMNNLQRITFNPEVMGGKPCIKGTFTVSTIVGLMASQYSLDDILQTYPYLELADIYDALAYAAWR